MRTVKGVDVVLKTPTLVAANLKNMTKEELYNLIQIKEAELDLLKKKLRELIYGNANNARS